MDTLPDDVLIAIFNSYLDEYFFEKEREEAWRSLVHVCHRWRTIVFEWPRHLDLQLVCTGRTRARDTLDVWTALPLAILCEDYDYDGSKDSIRNVDDIIAVLERRNRVCRINLRGISSSNLEIIFAAMQQPFPELTFLRLWSYNGTVPVVPNSFLGGLAPSLESLEFGYIPFPGLPKLLLSTTHLRFLRLNIPRSGTISPDAMVTILSTLTSLKSLTLDITSHRSFPDRATQRSPPSTRTVLPALTFFQFRGVSKYLDDLVARIDTPQLNELSITVFNDPEFDAPQFIQFVNRTPMLRALEEAHVTFSPGSAHVTFFPRTSGHGYLDVRIFSAYAGLHWQFSVLVRVCTSCLSPVSVSEDLYIYEQSSLQLQSLEWEVSIENGLWLELLRPFICVKNLYLSEEFVQPIAPALQELVEGRTIEVLPTLENILLEGLESGFFEESIGQLTQFVAAREVAGHPIAITHWDSSKGYDVG